MKGVLYHRGYLYIPGLICFKIISNYYNNLFASYFEMKKIEELITKKTADLPFIKMLNSI